MRNIFLFFFILLLFSGRSFSQIPVGQWREHLPYNKAIAVADDGADRIWCATPFSIFYYSRADESVNKLSRVNGLSDIGVSAIAYDKKTKTLIIGYENGNIDLLHNDEISNFSDIKRKQLVGGKRINNILIFNGKAYLSTLFGIVVFNIEKREISDTYFIGENGTSLEINKLVVFNDTFYAATQKGIMSAAVNNPNLANFQNWRHDSLIHNFDKNFNQIAVYDTLLLTNYKGASFGSDTLYGYWQGKWHYFKPFIRGPVKMLKSYGDTLVIGEAYGFTYYFSHLNDSFLVYSYNQSTGPNGFPYANDILIDKKGDAWIADDTRGLVENPREWLFYLITPSGPSSQFAWDMDAEGGRLWVVSGGRQPTGANMYLRKGVYRFYDEKWTSYDKRTSTVFDTIDDVISVAVNPKNPEEVYIGTVGQGLIKLKGGKVTNVFNSSNSSLSEVSNRPGYYIISGLAFDFQGNLWVANSQTPNGLSRMTPAGKWKSFSLAPYVTEDITGQIIVDDYNQKWIILPRQGILVYNDNFTEDNPWDDRKTLLNGAPGKGGLPDASVLCMAKDHDGEVWVGTAKGVAVFYSPELIFSGQEYDAQQIYIEQEGISQYLLESEEVTAVAIDGANRKWFGTANAGVFLMSPDGTKQIHHFNTENSPLLSDNILSIAIDGKSGEVFFATEKGIVSYRSDATEGSETQSQVSVFPNPVRPEYSGVITVSGLVANAEVKITDVAGNVIFEGTANGGTITWNGKNYSGERAATGVYLVFSTNEDGTETTVAKILFIH